MATEKNVRRVALALPETEESTAYRTPAYKVRGKTFLRLRTEAEGGLVVFVEDLGIKELLLESDPDKFFTTPHYDGHATVLVNLPAIGVEELTELVTDSWRLKAPPKVLREHPDI